MARRLGAGGERVGKGEAHLRRRVVEEDGTTDAVKWVGLAELAGNDDLALLPVVEYVLERIDQFVTGATGDTDPLGSGSAAGIQNSTA